MSMEEIKITKSRGLQFSYFKGIILTSSIFLGRFGEPCVLSSTLASPSGCSRSTGSVALRLELDMEELELSMCLSFSCPVGLDIIPCVALEGVGASDKALDVVVSFICSLATVEVGVLIGVADCGASGGEYCVLASTMRGRAWYTGSEMTGLAWRSGLLS
jgi:hypothetical protein